MNHFNRVFFHLLAIPALFYLGTITAQADRGLHRAGSSVNNETASTFTDGKYRAIVIGNNAYNDPKKVWRPLKTAVNDARAFADILRHHYGFSDINLLLNASRKQILSAINKMADKALPEDSILIYYAGHGWRNEKTQEAYWIPVDAVGEDDSYYLSNVRIREKLSVIASTASHSLLISDSCFSGSLLDSRSIRDLPDADANAAYYHKVSRRRSVQILAAGGQEFVDDNYRRSGHSPFTYFLIKELSLNDKQYITLSSLALQIEEQVAKNSQQTPQSGAIRMAGDEGGQFVFFQVQPSKTPAKSTRPAASVPASAPVAAQSKPNKPPKVAEHSAAQPTAPADNSATPATPANPPTLQAVTPPQQPQQMLASLQHSQVSEQIEALFAGADRDIARQRYSLPNGRNALDKYLSILRLDRNNRRVLAAMKRLFNETTRQVERHLMEHQIAQARQYLHQAERIDPENESNLVVLNDLRVKLDNARDYNFNSEDSGITVTRD